MQSAATPSLASLRKSGDYRSRPTIAPLSARSMTIADGDHGGGPLLLFLVARHWVSPFVTLVRQRATPTRWMRLPHLASGTTALAAKALRSRKALGHTAVTSSSRLCFSLADMLDPCFPQHLSFFSAGNQVSAFLPQGKGRQRRIFICFGES